MAAGRGGAWRRGAGALRGELRAAWRRVARQPAFAAVATLTFALGVAGTVLFFGVLDQVYLRPLPFPAAERLVRIRVALPTGEGGRYLANVLPREVLFLAERTRAFDAVAAQRAEQLTLLGAGDPLALRGASVSPRTLELFGWKPLAGRLFDAEEERTGAPVALINARLWRERFGGDPAVVGRAIRLDDRMVTVVGVLPQAFPYRADVWLPLRLDAADARDLLVIGRLAPGVGLESARAELDRVAEAYRPLGGDAGLDGTRLRDNLVRDEQRVAVALFIATLLFLALAAVNLAGLLAVRALARRRDLAVRAALGAGGARQVLGLLVEPGLVALLGAAAALVVVRAASPSLGALVPHVLAEELGYRVPGLDARGVLVALLASGGAALAAGLVPALVFARTPPSAALAAGRGAAQASRRRGTRALLVAQSALVFAILLGAGALIESFLREVGRGVGFASGGVLALEIQPPASRYPDAAARRRLVEELVAGVGALPGTEATLSTVNPLAGSAWGIGVRRAGSAASLLTANLRLVSPGFLGVLRVPLLRGRDLAPADRAGAAAVAVVSRRLALRLWGREDVVGERLERRARSDGEGPLTIVGVAADVADAFGPPDTVYLPFAQNAAHPAAAESLWLLVRGRPDQTPWVRDVERAIWRVDGALAWRERRTMDDLRAEGLAQPRLGSRLAAAFVLGALALTALGLGGAVAFAVRERRAEIGVRLALGAAPGAVVRLFAWRGAGQSAVGVAAGGAAFLVLRPVAAHVAAGAEAASVVTVAAAFLAVGVVAGLASYLPARGAARVDPASVLREE